MIDDRPRERLLGLGAQALSNAELLALALASGSAGRASCALARELLLEFGGLAGLFAAPVDQLLAQPGVGPARAALLRSLPALWSRLAQADVASRPVLADTSAARRFLQARLAPEESEVFGGLFLDTRNRLLAFDVLARGSIDRAVVYPRQVLRRALYHNCAAMIFAHNHPSGCAEPSRSDVELTNRLRSLLGEIDVRVLDHIVVAAGGCVSLADRGML